jgi:L-type amino acid transporter 9
MEAFGKKGKFGPLPAFVCSWVYVMILRPAEIAIIILTFAEYSIQPFHSMFGLENLTHSQNQLIIKIVALLALGKQIKKDKRPSQ